MKIRTDFVTNSSSSSFVIAHDNELNEKQKEVILDFVMQKFIGDEKITMENVDEYCDDYGVDDEQKAEIIEALKDGKTVTAGLVSFDCSDETLACLFQRFWRTLENADPEALTAIKTDLSY